jgi:hypothetical protein
VIVAGAALALTRGGAGPSESLLPTADQPRVDTPVPPLSHVYVLVLENKGYDRIVGSADAPFLNRLIDRYGLAEAYQGVAHPSQPNYLAMFSGSTHGVTDDHDHDLTGPTIADQLEAAGKTWRVVAENVPTDCFAGSTATDGPDGTGTYARKHNPAISFGSIRDDPARCANITDLSHFDPAAADYTLLVPNLCHDMHDCSISEGDAFVRDLVGRITASSAWQDGGVLFVTFDESEGSDSTGRVATIVVSPEVRAPMRSTIPHNHYSLLRTIEDGLGLGCLGEACSANTLGEFFAKP